jgi:hypothetical protein
MIYTSTIIDSSYEVRASAYGSADVKIHTVTRTAYGAFAEPWSVILSVAQAEALHASLGAVLATKYMPDPIPDDAEVLA